MSQFLGRLSNSLSNSRILSILSRSSDLVLVVFVVMIIMMIIVPVSTSFIDGMIAINLTASTALLVVSLYIPRAVNLSIFPSILLITTLFRLGIEIAATRQILLTADGGHIIHTFGNYVVGGNFIVGGIVFLIITIVQFIVVTKGAERVAEVAARFTLDAMPGKQMSIDADMRSGTIDAQKARDLRLALTKESQLYGAMDGAMKFVKGDVIAAIVIAVINIVGGLIIGIVVHKMSPMQSAQTYTLLSIGGGLVSQIPSLMIALTAGIITTRVSGDKADSSLGGDISEQLLKQPKALMIAAGVILMAGMIKGFPKPLFMGLALFVGGMGYYTYKKKKAKEQAAMRADGAIELDVDGHAVVGGGEGEYTLTVPLILELGGSLSKIIDGGKGEKPVSFLEMMVPKMRKALFEDLGVRFPGVHIRKNTPYLEASEYAILLNEEPVARGRIVENSVLTSEPTDSLDRLGVPYTVSQNSFGPASAWVTKDNEEILKKSGIRYWDAFDVIILHISQLLKSNAAEFVGVQETRSIISFLEKSYGDLVKEVTRLVPLQKLANILQRLVQEEISIKNLRTIMESLSENAQTEKDVVLLTEYVRSSLRRYITYKYTQGKDHLAVYQLHPHIEDEIAGAIKQTTMGSYLQLNPDTAQMILQGIREEVSRVPAGGQSPVIITRIDIRRFVRKLIESEFPWIHVISHQEVVESVQIQSLGTIELRPVR